MSLKIQYIIDMMLVKLILAGALVTGLIILGSRLGLPNLPEIERKVTPSGFDGDPVIVVKDASKIFLYGNFAEKLPASRLLQQSACESLVNGGFYTEKNEPIGLFVTEGSFLSQRAANATFDGYLTIDEAGNARIASYNPSGNYRVALQSGPILIENNQNKLLQLKNDERARRVVVGLTKDKKVIFAVFYDKDSVFNGPLLADLPRAVLQLGDEIGIEFESALNLDGGSASAFITPTFKVTEASPIGSYFCIRK